MPSISSHARAGAASIVGTRLRVLTLMFAGLVGVAMVLPSNFVVEGAGIVVDVNGQLGTEKVISVHGVATYPTNSHLYMTTVSAWGTPDNGTTGAHALQALISPYYQLYPVRALYSFDDTAEKEEEVNKQLMDSSQDSSAAVAFSMAGYAVKEKLTIVSLDPLSPAHEVLRVGDVIVGVKKPAEQQYTQILNFMNLSEFMQNIAPGENIALRVQRNGKNYDATFATVKPQADTTGWVQAGSLIGAGVNVSDIQLPGDVEYSVQDVGGPSAGTMFMLGIYDQLTQGSLSSDAHIAGTGAISWNGSVEPIGGAVHKLRGAAEQGATDFLLPAENCAEVENYVPEGMNVWAIRSASEAIKAARAIGADQTDGLTPCSALSAFTMR